MKFDGTKLRKVSESVKTIPNIESNIKVNNIYLTKDGNPFFVVSGEFHYSRYDYRLWEDEVLKMKAAGCNIIATYCFWNHHEYRRGEWNFEGDMNLKLFLSLCNKHGMYVILRLGPWCHGEVVLGGFPKYVAKYPFVRQDNKKYLGWVKELYTQFYRQSKDYLYPNGTVIAIQLENEYTGKYSHIQTLKKLAIEVGFNLPLYTATAWPAKLNDEEVLPMRGGYPEAPWTQNIKPLSSADRFKILPQFYDENIGNDIIKVNEKMSYDKTPLAYCELGVGVQATKHRRPIITSMDAYAMCLTTLAKGANCLGYYVFHGGRNPNFAPLQETRRTFYPNNLPLLNYDFQAPINEYGYATDKMKWINLIHTFCNTFDRKLPTMQAVFSPDVTDKYSSSIRINAEGSGYHFITAYERLSQTMGGEISAQITTTSGVINTPKITLKNGELFFYPFNLQLGDLIFKYITAQPFMRVMDGVVENIYLIKHSGNDVKFESNADVKGSREGILEIGKYDITKAAGRPITLHIIEMAKALNMHYNSYDGKCYANENFVYFDKTKAIAVKHIDAEDSQNITLTEVVSKRKKYDTYFYGKNKMRLYKLSVPSELIDKYEDLKISFKYFGDMAHVYVGDKVCADFININNDFNIYLSRLADGIRRGEEILIRTNAIKKNQLTYFETEVKPEDSSLAINKITIVEKELLND